MRILIKKELTSLLCSGIGAIFAFVFLISCGLLLWVFTGRLNILDNGYATLESFFSLAPILLLVLTPALTMRLFADEKKSGTLSLLRSRPFSISSIWFSKWIATLVFVFLIIISTITYVYTLYISGNPVGNIDLNVIVASYFSLIILVGVFLAIGLFASTLSGNQITALIIGLFLNFFCYYGFDLIAALFQSGKLETTISSLGLTSHFKQMQRGVIEITDISTSIIYIIISWMLSICVLNLKNRPPQKYLLITLSCILTACFLNTFLPFIRFDFTKDKRYSISDYSKRLLSEVNGKIIQVNIYLEGNLNAGFQRLQNATKDLLYDFNRYSSHKIETNFIEPASVYPDTQERTKYMMEQGMNGILLNEVDRYGKLSQQMIYPYAQLIMDNDTLTINLLKNIQGNTAEENLNISAENLEFQFIDALRLLIRNEEQNIAFIEGHDELDRAYIYDAEEALAKYFYINRGQISNDISILDNFKVIIIAGPTSRFSESEKFILDQYIMKGGRILWLIDGAYIDQEDLETKGQSASIKNETGLDDLLFKYGIRIEADLLQDIQSSQILVNTGTEPQAVTIPWYYSPLLISSPNNYITKDIGEVSSEFVSSISLLKSSETLNRSILLTTSNNSHIVRVPEMIDFDIQKIQSNTNYFNDSFIPVAVSLEGQFSSAFENRITPDSIYPKNYIPLSKSNITKMIVVSTSSIIKNKVIGYGEDTHVLPMGYDRILKRTYGNRDFIINAVNWLANDDEWMLLKEKNRNIQLLNKQMIYENRIKYSLLNTAVPFIFIGIIIMFINIRRRRRYKK